MALSSVRECDFHPDFGARIAVVVWDLAKAVAPVQAQRRRHLPLRVEPEPHESETARVLEALLHQPPAEAVPLARGPDPHALELAEPLAEAADPRGADDAALGVLHHEQ